LKCFLWLLLNLEINKEEGNNDFNFDEEEEDEQTVEKDDN